MKLFIFSFFISYSLLAEVHARFECSEHVLIGNELQLPGFSSNTLSLANGLQLSFGELIALGDFYGVVGSPVSGAKTPAERQAVFSSAFNSFAATQSSVEETQKIVSELRTELKLVLDEAKQGKSVKEIYDRISKEQTVKWNCLTGGACSGTFWWLSPGRYLLLAEQDYDHFGDNAVKAYVAGHFVAMKEAQAGNLEKAYAMEAFAVHFLTDRFSAGHIRAPRVELANTVTPAVVGSLLVMFMHNEESAYGLHVHSARGDHWVAYGDHYYSDPRNQENLKYIREALGLSIEQVFKAFSQKQLSDPQVILDRIPMADETGTQVKKDIAPMFYWDAENQVVKRRSYLTDPYSADWTSYWFGWSTLALLNF